jgi:hypothetical protein
MNLIEKRELKLLIKEIIKEELTRGSSVNEAYKGERWYETGGKKPKRTLMDKFRDYLGVAAVGMGLGLLPGIAPDEDIPQRRQASSLTSPSVSERRAEFKISDLFSNTGVRNKEELKELDVPSFVAAVQLMIENIPSGLSRREEQEVNRLITRIISSRRELQRVQTNDLRTRLRRKLNS